MTRARFHRTGTRPSSDVGSNTWRIIPIWSLLLSFPSLRALITGAVGALAAVSAHAHVTARPAEGVAGSYFEMKLNVPHGCGTSPTVAIRVKIPGSVTAVKPQMKPGWKVDITTRKLRQPIKGERGQTITEIVDEVAWRGGPLPDHLFDNFGLIMKLPDAAGETLHFPVVQECQKGSNRWIEIPTAGQRRGERASPAPSVRLIPEAAPQSR